ncbi:hypothetical protein [Nocardia sp. NPDC004711]
MSSNPDNDLPMSELYLPDGQLNPEYTRGVPPSDEDIAMILEARNNPPMTAEEIEEWLLGFPWGDERNS